MVGASARVTLVDVAQGRFAPGVGPLLRVSTDLVTVVLSPEPALARRLLAAGAAEHDRGAALVDVVERVARRLGAVPRVSQELAAATTGVLHRLIVELGAEAFELRALLVPESLVGPERASVTRLGDVPIRLEVVAATLALTRREASRLVPGALLLAEGGEGLRAVDGRWTGAVALAAPRSEWALVGELDRDGRLLFVRPRPLPWGTSCAPGLGGPRPLPRDTPGALGHDEPVLLEDAALVVRVEVGSLSLSAVEWASLSPGDVVAPHAVVGRAAVLRVGGAIFARGELCDVSGRLAVRVAAQSGRAPAER